MCVGGGGASGGSLDGHVYVVLAVLRMLVMLSLITLFLVRYLGRRNVHSKFRNSG